MYVNLASIGCGHERVERHGPDARFQPIKTPDDIAKELPDIVKALKARGSL